MEDSMSTDCIVLDDGTIYIDLNVNYEPSSAPGFLMRRCYFGPTTPGGCECIGSFYERSDGTWEASINAPYDPTHDSDSTVVVEGVSRMDAIAALWHDRHNAHCQLI